MKLWDMIFPVEREIILWGAGEKGRYWLDRLGAEGKHVKYIIDRNYDKKVLSIDNAELQILPPKYYGMGDEILIITSVNYCKEIYDEAYRLGYRDILFGRILELLPSANVEINDFPFFPPFGHFYSAYPDVKFVIENYAHIAKYGDIHGDDINYNYDEEKEILNDLKSNAESMDIWGLGESDKTKYRFKIDNNSFNISDALLLNTIIRRYKPKQIIEIGSGFSSAVTMDTNELYFRNNICFKMIEPYPNLVLSLMNESDYKSVELLPNGLQEVPLDFFDSLQEKDILFVDSTHVSKFGSDVNYLFFCVLPRLNPGVIVHFHDIFYPWEYPQNWIENGIGWNEMYLLRAFLQGNKNWEILFYNNYIGKTQKDGYSIANCENERTIGGSFWIRKK